MTTTTITMRQALALYRAGNDAGRGYAPYTDEAGDDTIAEAVACAERDGWEVVLARETSSDVVVLRNGDSEWLAIGGDAMGRGAWAVEIEPGETRRFAVWGVGESTSAIVRAGEYDDAAVRASNARGWGAIDLDTVRESDAWFVVVTCDPDELDAQTRFDRSVAGYAEIDEDGNMVSRPAEAL